MSNKYAVWKLLVHNPRYRPSGVVVVW